jgi:DNA-binding XRE family transcriptional regulator
MPNSIKYWREHNKTCPDITQKELAEKIGIDRPTLSKIENQIIDPSEDMAQKIAQTLGLLITDILRKPLGE